MQSSQLSNSKAALRQKLYLATPCGTKRYDDRATSAQPARDWPLDYATHLSTHRSAPPYARAGNWQSFTHPEGKRYHARGTAPRIITEVDLADESLSNAVAIWTEVILEWAAELDLHLDPSVELYLEPELDSGICDYYFADHGSRAIFWLEASMTSELGLPPACSDRHLKLALEENYWKHVEMFCMHLEDLPGALEELITIYLHGRADLATSSTSTFYFTPEVTDAHLDILMKCRSMPRNPMTFSFIGRLWGYMANARFQNFYGENHCRLDRTTRVFAHEQRQPGVVSQCVSAAMFGLPQDVRVQLDVQLVDELVIEKVWSAFIANQITEWRTIMQWTFALVIPSVLALPISPIPVLAHISLVLSAAAILLAVVLQQHFKCLTQDVDDACSFLTAQKGNMTPLAIVFCLPRAAFLWSLVIFLIQASCMLLCTVSFNLGIIITLVMLTFALGIWKILNPSHRLVSTATIAHIPILSFFRRSEKIKDVESSI